MIPATGARSNGKIIKYRLPDYEGEEVLKLLSKRMVDGLITSLQPLEWMSRHIQLPVGIDNQELLTDWVADLRKRLMSDFDFCLHVSQCIDDDDRVKNSLRQFIEANYEISNAREQTTEESSENVDEGNNPTCDQDLLFTKCKAVIHYTHLGITDTLQKVITAAGVVDLAKALWDSVPGLALVDDAAGANGVVQLVQYYRDAVSNSYSAQYTETPGGTEDELAYQLYCKCKSDCRITIDRIVDMYSQRLSVYTSPPSLEGLINFLETLAGIEADTTFIVDLSHYAAWGLVKVASVFFGATRHSNSFLQLMLNMVDEGDGDLIDMEGFFGECPPECAFEVFADFDMITNPDGQESALGVLMGQTYTIYATGTWNGGAGGDISAEGLPGTFNPSSIEPTARLYSILVKTSESGVWYGGDEGFNYTAPISGFLYFAFNDVPGAHTDNTGSMCINIELVE